MNKLLPLPTYPRSLLITGLLKRLLRINIFKEIQECKSNRLVCQLVVEDRKPFQGRAENLNISYETFSHDVKGRHIGVLNSEMAAMLVPQTNPVGVEPFFIQKLPFVQ